MSDQYSRQRKSAYETISRKGQDVTVYKLGTAAYDPLNPSGSTFTVQASFVGKGVVLPSNKATIEAFDARILQDPLQVLKFRYVLFSGYENEFQVEVDYLLKTAEGFYRVRGITLIDPAGTGPIIYNLYCLIDETINLP